MHCPLASSAMDTRIIYSKITDIGNFPHRNNPELRIDQMTDTAYLAQ